MQRALLGPDFAAGVATSLSCRNTKEPCAHSAEQDGQVRPTVQSAHMVRITRRNTPQTPEVTGASQEDRSHACRASGAMRGGPTRTAIGLGGRAGAAHCRVAGG